VTGYRPDPHFYRQPKSGPFQNHLRSLKFLAIGTAVQICRRNGPGIPIRWASPASSRGPGGRVSLSTRYLRAAETPTRPNRALRVAHAFPNGSRLPLVPWSIHDIAGLSKIFASLFSSSDNNMRAMTVMALDGEGMS
jgi:hypothetical protein